MIPTNAERIYYTFTLLMSLPILSALLIIPLMFDIVNMPFRILMREDLLFFTRSALFGFIE